MRELWTGEIVGKMHVNCISYKTLADELGWNVKYLSAVLNGHRKPKGSEEKVKDALSKIISKNLGGKPFIISGSETLLGNGGSGAKKPVDLKELADSLKRGM